MRHERSQADGVSEVAKAAVRALAEGRVDSIDEAVDRAMHETRADASTRRPTRAELRAHARLHEESVHGEQGRRGRIDDAIAEVLEVLSVLEHTVLLNDPAGPSMPQPQVYGRAAVGQFDLDPTAHARVTTSLPASIIAQALLEAGFSDPECGSVATRHGRIDEIRFDGAEVHHRVLRIPPALAADPDRDLIHGRSIEHATFAELAARQEESRKRREARN